MFARGCSAPERSGCGRPGARNASWRALSAVLAVAAAAPSGLVAAPVLGRAPAAPPPLVDTSAWTVRHMAGSSQHQVLPASTYHNLLATGVGVTAPFWSMTITSPLDHGVYNVSMVGSSPYAATPVNTNITYVPIVLRLHFKGGYVLDPTANGNCDTAPVSQRFFNSPLFQARTFTSNGVTVSAAVGGSQLTSAFQRANFWNAVKTSAYGVTLVPSRTAPIVVDYTPTAAGDTVVGVRSQCVTGQTNALGLIDINEYDTLIQQLTAVWATSTQVPIVLTYNVVAFTGLPALSNCCVLGYHNAISTAKGTQLYAVGAYLDPGIFTGVADISVWSHELGELVDDPFVQSIPGAPGGYANGLTPAWGRIGQVGGCQDNLEVGDPLSGTLYTIGGVAGFAYHYQDLAFHDWFYRTASTSAGGKGSFTGVLAGGGQTKVCR